MKKYKIEILEDTFNFPSYLKFAGNKFKEYEQILYASAIDFYLKQLIKNKRNSIKLIIIPKNNLMKGSFANIVLNSEALKNNNFILNINKNVSYKNMLNYIAHEITHIAQIVNGRLSTKDFKTLQ